MRLVLPFIIRRLAVLSDHSMSLIPPYLNPQILEPLPLSNFSFIQSSRYDHLDRVLIYLGLKEHINLCVLPYQSVSLARCRPRTVSEFPAEGHLDFSRMFSSRTDISPVERPARLHFHKFSSDVHSFNTRLDSWFPCDTFLNTTSFASNQSLFKLPGSTPAEVVH